MLKKQLSILLGVLLLLAAIAVAPAHVPALLAQETRTNTVRFYDQTVLTGSSTVFSSSALSLNGRELNRVSGYKAADVFVTGDLGTTVWMTVTAQFSADCSNWADADYDAVTFNTSGTATQNKLPYRVWFSSDATKRVTVPISGECMRFKIEKTGSVTPTIWATLRDSN